MFEFFGNFFLALALVGLFRFLWMVCGLLVRTGDVGNVIFAVALPVLMLYLLGLTMLPIDAWEGFAAGAATGLIAVHLVRRKKPPTPA